MAFLKMTRQQRKTGEQTKEIGQDYPFVCEMGDKSGHAGAKLETRKGNLVERNGDCTSQCNRERVAVKQRHTEQSQRKQDEIKGDSSYRGQGISSGCKRLRAAKK